MAQRKKSSQIWYHGVRLSVRLAAMIIYRLKASGTQNIPAKGAALVVVNHQSHLDPPLIGCCSKRRMSFLARANLFKFAPFAWFIRSIDAFPIDLEGSRLSGIRETLKRLKNGEIVAVFPEGSRTFDGELQPFKPGFVALAIRSRVPILPAAIEGAYHAWPRQNRLPWLWFGRVHVHFGEPIPWEEVQKLNEDELQELALQKIRECHDLLCSRPVFAKHRSR